MPSQFIRYFYNLKASILDAHEITSNNSNPLILLTFSGWHLLRRHNTIKEAQPLRLCFFIRFARCEMGFELHELRSLTSGLLRCNHPRPDLCLLGVALRKINEANCRDPFRLYGGGILPARSNQVMLCANKSIIVKRKSERQITRSKFAQSENRT